MAATTTTTPAPKPTVVTQVAPSGVEVLNVVETPTSPSSVFVLSRFEFETGKGNEGTKILMVEWDASSQGASIITSATTNGPTTTTKTTSSQQQQQQQQQQPRLSDWDVSWDGKTQVLPILDPDTEARSLLRVLFLLPPGAHVPALVTITPRTTGGAGPGAAAAAVLRTKPMPAIFPAALGVGSKEAGKRGVLHSLWARGRLAELQAEVTSEMRANSESIGLEMALQERDWITDHFGVGDPSDAAAAAARKAIYPLSPHSPASPRSPLGGRLGEKLKGLKLATSPTDLAAAEIASKSMSAAAAAGARSADVNASSYATFQSRTPPKSSIEPTVASLDAVLDGTAAAADSAKDEAPDAEDGLFALPMSPRSPEMAKSPFSLLK